LREKGGVPLELIKLLAIDVGDPQAERHALDVETEIKRSDLAFGTSHAVVHLQEADLIGWSACRQVPDFADASVNDDMLVRHPGRHLVAALPDRIRPLGLALTATPGHLIQLVQKIVPVLLSSCST
jgi:hypothetical protein